jgi:hypothetical protein
VSGRAVSSVPRHTGCRNCRLSVVRFRSSPALRARPSRPLHIPKARRKPVVLRKNMRRHANGHPVTCDAEPFMSSQGVCSSLSDIASSQQYWSCGAHDGHQRQSQHFPQCPRRQRDPNATERLYSLQARRRGRNFPMYPLSIVSEQKVRLG